MSQRSARKTSPARVAAIARLLFACALTACSAIADGFLSLAGDDDASPPIGQTGVPDAGRGLYVHPTGDDTNAGTPESPMRSITHALEAISQNQDAANPYLAIYIAQGTYEETIHVSPGIALHGGFAANDTTWQTWNPARYLSTIIANPGLVARDVVTPTIISGLNIVATADPTSVGVSTLGVYIENSPDLTLADIMITAHDATPGADGTDGDIGADGSPGAPGVGALGGLPSTGGCTAGGAGGHGGFIGTALGSSGETAHPFAPGGNGGDIVSCKMSTCDDPLAISGTCQLFQLISENRVCGLVGKPVCANSCAAAPGDGLSASVPEIGKPGVGSTSETIAPVDGLLQWVPTPATNGVRGANGVPGGGAGGASLGLMEPGPVGVNGGGGGAGGNGGCGGGAGGAGGAGGSSTGIIVANSTVKLARAKIIASDGGHAGRGGNAAAGGAGGQGGRGGAATYFPWNGGRGGGGSRGANGTAGGGGQGGASFGILLVRGGIAELEDNTVEVTEGKGGTGGAGGLGVDDDPAGGAGTNGPSGAIYTSGE